VLRDSNSQQIQITPVPPSRAATRRVRSLVRDYFGIRASPARVIRFHLWSDPWHHGLNSSWLFAWPLFNSKLFDDSRWTKALTGLVILRLRFTRSLARRFPVGDCVKPPVV